MRAPAPRPTPINLIREEPPSSPSVRAAQMVSKLVAPTLCIQAEDDPIAPAAAIPRGALAANPSCILVTTPRGGHLGWVAGAGGLMGAPWTDTLVVEYVQAVVLHGGV